MKINKKTEYALSIVLYVAYTNRGNKLVNTSQIYDSTQVPKKFLTVILSELQRAGILKSIRGSKGGYELGRNPKDTSLYDIISAVSPQGRKEKETIKEGTYRDLSATILEELDTEFINKLKNLPLSILLKRLENMFSPMTPMFYI